MTTPKPPTRDEFIEAQVERVLARNAAILPAELVEELRHVLRLAYRNGTRPGALIDAIRPRAQVIASDEIAKEGVAPIEDESKERAGKGR